MKLTEGKTRGSSTNCEKESNLVPIAGPPAPRPSQEGQVDFIVNDSSDAILSLRPNGDIYVKGKLVENDKEVVNAMRDFLSSTGTL